MKRLIDSKKDLMEAWLRLRSLGIKNLWMEDTGLIIYLEHAVYCRRSYNTVQTFIAMVYIPYWIIRTNAPGGRRTGKADTMRQVN